jgi:hypothetical protein
MTPALVCVQKSQEKIEIKRLKIKLKKNNTSQIIIKG